jgi:subtilisin family serine protease
MKKLYVFLTIAILVSGHNLCFAQSQTKFDFYLAFKQVNYKSGHENGSELLPVFVRGNISGIKKLVESSRGIFKYSYGSIAAIQIPISALQTFYESGDVVRMEGKPSHMRVLNDSMRVHNHMVEVQMGQSPLTKGYKGKGIVLGFIDSGIDFLHPDFCDSTGKSRIQFLWDQNQPNGPNTPLPYGYGQAWTKKQIDSVVANNDVNAINTMDSSGQFEYGHGSTVAGTGAGNALSNGLNMGADPEADIIMVAYNFYSNNPNLLTDATDYIYAKAAQLGEPCVINASLGDYEGSHDGYDLQAQLVDSMTIAQPGRCFVAAAGNAGDVPFHLGYTLTPNDTNFTWFSYDGAEVDIQVYADTASFRNVHYSIGVDQNSPDFVFRGQTNFRTIFPYLGHIGHDTIKNAAHQRIGIITTYAQLIRNSYSLEFYIKPDSTSYYWRLSTTGSGKFDCWDFDYIVNSGLPSPVAFPVISNYKLPDTMETLCTSFQCSPHVITVGNYWNRGTIIDYDTQYVTVPNYMKCMLAANSSIGPTRDGRYKPDITAPGNRVLSAYPTQFRAFNIVNSPTVIDEGGWHIIDGGTSMASPEVAGAAGMILGLYPTATNDQIKNMIIYCADQDVCTGSNLPDNYWGYGKLDAFKAMTGCTLGYVNIPNNITPSDLSVFPNPMTQNCEITYDFSTIKDFCTANITLYDVMGKAVKTIELKNNQGNVTLTKGDLQGGTYFYSLTVDETRLKTEKLVIL